MVGEIKESEQLILGWLLDPNNQEKTLIERLVPQDFYIEAHRIIFEAMRDLYQEDKPIELITINDYITEKGKIEKIGGASYPAELSDIGSGYPLSSIIYHIERIKENGDRRRLTRWFDEAREKVEENIPILEIVDHIQQKTREIQIERGREIMPELNLEGYKEWLKSIGTGELTGFDTGFPNLNAQTGGLSGLWVIGAGPKMHKSTFALQIARNIAEEGNRVLFYDLENGENRILTRLHSGYAMLGLETLRKIAGGNDEEGAKKEEVTKYKQGLDKIEALKEGFTLITDRNEVNLLSIEAQIRAVIEKDKIEGNKILLVFDPLQKLPSTQKERRLQIDEWLRHFERLKNEFSCNILIISELRRGQKDYSNVTIQDFKESGDIEYTAETLIGINRPGKGEDKYKLNVLASRDEDSGLVEATYIPRKPYWYMEEKR